MGQSKRPSRLAEIAEKKKTEKIRLRLKKTREYQTFKTFHFRNQAARAAAGDTAHLRNSLLVTQAVNDKKIGEQFVQAVPIKVETVKITPLAKKVNIARPLVLVTGRKLNADEWASHVLALAQIAEGRGWRQPSAKEKNWKSTSLVMKASLAAGLHDPIKFERSERGKKKLLARIETNALITIDRLIEQWPDRARKAKGDERMLNWFVAAVEERFDVDRDWLTSEVKERIKRGGIEPKFKHSKQRDWLVQQEAA